MAKRKPAKSKAQAKAQKPKKKPKSPAGRKAVYTDEEIIAGLQARHGLVSLAAKHIGCIPDTIYTRMKSSPAIKAAIKGARKELCDTAEDKLWNAVNQEAPWAIQLTMRTLGRKRGYVERTEQRIGGDKNAPPIQTQSAISIDALNLPIEVRRQILEAMEKAAEVKTTPQTIV